MTKEQMDALVELGQADGMEVRAYNDGQQSYSGRGMYGRQTYAIVADSVYNIGRLEQMYREHMEEKGEPIEEDGRLFRTDNMGKYDIIAY